MTEPALLPDRLRLRIVALVSAVLPALAPVPPQLRLIAGFAPARRARLGGSAIWSSLQEAEFRRHAAIQVAAAPAQDNDPADVAARAWLIRMDGWEAVVEEIALDLESSQEETIQSQHEIERQDGMVASLQVALAAARRENEDELAKAKADHAVLRRRLGEARAAVRAAETERDQAASERDDAVAAAAAASRSAEVELRRLSVQFEEVKAALTATRRDSRTARDTASVRASYLLEAVIEAATGLRRELSLPAVKGAPGDDLEAALAHGDTKLRSTGSLTSAALEQLLLMPRSRVLIDGYNVTKTTWPSATLQAQRSRLVTALGPLVARTGVETTVVFDAGASSARTAMPSPRGVRVVFSPEGVIADDVIRQLVDAEPMGRVVMVVTDDQELGRDVTRAGARVVSVSSLLGLVTT